MIKLLCIAAGGGAGALCRYALSGVCQSASGVMFPIGTLTVNVLGCLLIGILGAVFASPQLVREEIRLFLMIGLLGGFTTFSTFGFETLELMNDRQFSLAAANVALSNTLGLAAVWIGYRMTERVVGV